MFHSVLNCHCFCQLYLDAYILSKSCSFEEHITEYRRFLIISFLLVFQVNLSPALGNDCDIDTVVKKPMLHDMFDLLGLPMCNTGLSLFTVWHTSSNKEHPNDSNSSENEDCENARSTTGVMSGRKEEKPAVLRAAEAVSRWKRQHQQTNHILPQGTTTQRARKKNASLPVVNQHCPPECTGTLSSCSQMSSGKNCKNQNMGTRTFIKCSSTNQKIVQNLYSSSAVTFGEDEDDSHGLINSRISEDPDETWTCYNSLFIGHNKNKVHGLRGQNKYPPKMSWGNGRDWTVPPVIEGNWVRLYPLGSATQYSVKEPQETPSMTQGERQVKDVVSAVHKYSKTAREIFKRNPTCSDEVFNKAMKQTLGMTSDVWLPSK